MAPSRPRLLLLLALVLFTLTLVLHPSSPASYRTLSEYVPSRSSGYPPNLPDRLKAGFTNASIADEGGWEDRRKANATFVVLARNSDLWEIIPSIQVS